jgi:DNA-binding GntR family transcriptional regulator
MPTAPGGYDPMDTEEALLSAAAEVRQPSARIEPTTRSAVVHAQLREDIRRGRLQAGSRLRFVELATRFAVSQSVVREALTRLAEQGLAVALPQQGFRVTPLDRKHLDELTEARVFLETGVVRLAVERGDLGWESSVLAAHHQLSRTQKFSAPEELNAAWFDAHEQFHQSLLQGCGNDRLFALASSLRDAASLYRWWAHPMGDGHHRRLDQEHQELLDAVLGRDQQNAADLLEQHIRRTSESLHGATRETVSADDPADSQEQGGAVAGRPRRRAGSARPTDDPSP